MTDAEALMPGDAPDTDPTVADPTVSELAAGAAVNEVDAFDEAAFDELTLLPLQLSAIERLLMNEPPDAEQGVPGRLAAFIVVEANPPVAEEAALDDVVVADAPAPGVVPVCEAVCAWAAADVASQMIIKEPATRCIEPSLKPQRNFAVSGRRALDQHLPFRQVPQMLGRPL